LPDGVTVKSTTPPQVDNDAIVPSGVAGAGTIATAVYAATSGTTPAHVRILVANANGITTGEFCTVNGDIAAGHSPKAAGFSIAGFQASDANGNELTGLTPGFTAEIL